MNCFYHPETASVGLCKSCYRGICLECAVATRGGLACRGSCETDVVAVHRMVRFNEAYQSTAKQNYRGTRTAWIVGGAFVALFGFLFAGIALAGPTTSLWLLAFGLLIGSYGCYMAIRAWRYKLPPDLSDDPSEEKP